MEIINPHRFATSAQAFDGFGNASRSFNGTSDYVSIPDNADIPTGAQTWSCWVKIDVLEVAIFCAHWNSSGDQRSFQIYLDGSGKINVTVNPDGLAASNKTVTSTSTVSTRTWYHITGVFSPSTYVKIFIDGIEDVEVTSSIPASVLDSTADIGIGAYADSSLHFDGNIADVRIYDAELSASDIADLYAGTNVTTNLVGHWLKDTPSLLDHAGNNDATNYGSKFSYDNPSPAVEFGSMSRLFNGASDYVDLGNSTDFSFSDTVQDEPFSLCAWIKCADNARFRVLSKDNGFGSSQEWLLATDAGGNLNVYLIDSGQFRGREYTTPLPENEWVHVASTYDGSGGSNFRLGLKLYVNGVQVDNANFGIAGYVAMSASTNNDVFIGRYGTSYSDGKIADARIYDAELSSTDVSDIYNGTNVTTNLIGHWLTNNDDADDYAGTNDGTNNGSTYSYDNPNALVEYGGASRAFNGTSNYISVNKNTIDGLSKRTISAWVKRDTATIGAIFGVTRDRPSRRFRFIIRDTGEVDCIWSDGGSTLIVTTRDGAQVPLNTWTHVTATFDNTGDIKRYVNGSPTGTVDDLSSFGDLVIQDDPFIGARNFNGVSIPFDGKISDLRIYDAELTSTEVYELYKGVDHRTNLIGQWLTNSDDVEDKAGTNDGTNYGSNYSTDSPL